jgi:hypothetical protein
MDMIFDEAPAIRNEFVSPVVDDTLVWSQDLPSHRMHVCEVLDRMVKNNFLPKFAKCQWCLPEVKFFGRIVSSKGIGLDRSKIEVLQNLCPEQGPESSKKLDSLIGLLLWHSPWIPKYSDKMSGFFPSKSEVLRTFG